MAVLEVLVGSGGGGASSEVVVVGVGAKRVCRRTSVSLATLPRRRRKGIATTVGGGFRVHGTRASPGGFASLTVPSWLRDWVRDGTKSGCQPAGDVQPQPGTWDGCPGRCRL